MDDRSTREWLSEIALDELTPIFEEKGLHSLQSVLTNYNQITDDVLSSWGISKIGYRKKLLTKIREKLGINEQNGAIANSDTSLQHPQAGASPLDLLQVAQLSKQSPRLASTNNPAFLNDLANIASMQPQHPLQNNYRTAQTPPATAVPTDNQIPQNPVGNIPANRTFTNAISAMANFHAYTVPKQEAQTRVNQLQQQQQPSADLASIVWYKIKDATGNKRKRAGTIAALDSVETPSDFVHNQLIYPFPAVHVPPRMQPHKCIVKLFGKAPGHTDIPGHNSEDREYPGGLGADTEVTFNASERVFVFDKVKIIHLKKQDKHHKQFIFKFLVYDSQGNLLANLDSEPFKILTHISQRGKDSNMNDNNNTEPKKQKKPKTPNTHPLMQKQAMQQSPTTPQGTILVRLTSSQESIPVTGAISLPMQTQPTAPVIVPPQPVSQ